LDQNQLMSLLRHLPGVFKLPDQQGGTLKEDVAQTLSNLSHAPFNQSGHHALGIQHPYPGQHTGGLPGINDPGPSSHPRGPPNLGQLSAVAMQANPASVGSRPSATSLPPGQVPPAPSQGQEMEISDGDGAAGTSSAPQPEKQSPSPTTGRTRGGRSATIGSDEWTRQRKDNHKEVERRRRGNINEGINELGRIVPNGTGEKAKGAILSRAVQYIHHLKDNEARNIEKWTLEKLLMDQAMGDLQAQLEEIKRMWEEERAARQRAESELEVLRGIHGVVGQSAAGSSVPVTVGKADSPNSAQPSAVTTETPAENANKRRTELGLGQDGEISQRNDKKPRTD